MTWTNEKPTQPGWYWWRSRPNAANEPVLVFVGFNKQLNVIFSGLDGRIYPLDAINGKWSGPIPEPEDE